MEKASLKLLGLLDVFRSGGKVSTLFRRINIALFILVTSIIVAVMYSLLQNISDTVSRDYARLYSANTAGTLNTYIGVEIALMRKAAGSEAVTDWFRDEENEAKKSAAYDKMMGIIDALSSGNLYIGIAKTLHEYSIESYSALDDVKPFATLDPGYFDDAWYFECVASDKDYLLNIDVDKVKGRRLVWLNYKVSRDGEVLGAICTGLEISDLISKLFSGYVDTGVRGLVIDENGVIQMDSTLMNADDFLLYTTGKKHNVMEEFPTPEFLSAAESYLAGISGNFDTDSETSIIPLSGNQYRYATISPIAYTTWSVVTFYDSSALFNVTTLLPMLVIVLVMFAVFIVVTGMTSTKLIFSPFTRLMESIGRIKEDMHEQVYGTERNDEIGDLANTVQNMKDNLIDVLGKVNYDALTGIYNRRFLDEHLNRIVKNISRARGTVSVMMLDVDFFKKYNDTYGHGMGDICLKKIAQTLSECVGRADDFVARYGGEEFVAVLPNTGESGVRIIARRMLEGVRQCAIPHSKNDVADCVTISIGCATGPANHKLSGDDFIKLADEALYSSKQGGRNRYTIRRLGVSHNHSDQSPDSDD